MWCLMKMAQQSAERPFILSEKDVLAGSFRVPRCEWTNNRFGLDPNAAHQTIGNSLQ